MCKHAYVYVYLKSLCIVLVGTVFANGPIDRDSIAGRILAKTQNKVLDASLLYTQHFKVRIKGKVEQSREKRSTLSDTLV